MCRRKRRPEALVGCRPSGEAVRLADETGHEFVGRMIVKLASSAHLLTGAFPKKSDTDKNYVELMQLLLGSGIYHGIATHDEQMIDATIEFAKSKKVPKSAYEFQMLYGVRRDLQEKLAREGYNMRVYVPYGKHWYP